MGEIKSALHFPQWEDFQRVLEFWGKKENKFEQNKICIKAAELGRFAKLKSLSSS